MAQQAGKASAPATDTQVPTPNSAPSEVSADIPPVLTKKQQAILAREAELLDIAKAIVIREGFAHLTMDKVAAASPYSKGTIYNHFISKEDLVTALAAQAFKQEIQLFRRALAFDGNSREKVVAMHVGYSLFTRMEPVLSLCVLTSRTPLVIEKSSPQRLASFSELEEELVGISDQFLANGLESGALVLPDGLNRDSVVFANWSMAFGSNALMNNASQSCCVSRIAQNYSILQNANLLLDGLRWRPMSADFDYFQSWKRIEEEVFAHEVHLLNALQATSPQDVI